LSHEDGLPIPSAETTVQAAMHPSKGKPIRAYWQIFDSELPSRIEYDKDLKMNIDKGQRIWFGDVANFFTSTAGSEWNKAIIKPYLAPAISKKNQDNAKPSTVNVSNPQGIIRITAYHESFKEVSLSNDSDAPIINHPIARQGEVIRSHRPKPVVQTVIGTMIVHVRTGDKVEIFNVPYSSGRGTSDQTMPDAGPTPEGVYSVNPKAVQNMSMAERLKDERQNSDELAFHNLAKLTIADADYGIFRVKLNVDESNPTTRHSMYIHGGKRMGSIGCLDVGKQQNWFYEQLRKSTHPFPVYVHWKK
jgi:hypothetical protein